MIDSLLTCVLGFALGGIGGFVLAVWVMYKSGQLKDRDREKE